MGRAASRDRLTLVALPTSIPELVTTIAAQRRGESDLVVGNLSALTCSTAWPATP